ncbi:hypothetical protein V8F06_001241 [Rhypophila decipiens]
MEISLHNPAYNHTSHPFLFRHDTPYRPLIKNKSPRPHKKGIKLTHSNQKQYSTSTSTPHRPQINPVQPRKVPLMQGFRTSAPKPTRLDTSTIDFAYLPNLHQESSYDPYLNIRVPLLPDSKVVPTNRQPEHFDAPLPKPEIVVLAAIPGTVYTASALTEVEGMGVDGVELRFAHDLEGSSSSNDELLGGQGMIKDLWKGLVDDVLGPAKPKFA